MLLLMVSSIITSVSRVSFGIETAGASRYRINGIIFFITLYFWFIETRHTNKRLYLYGILVFFTGYYFFINIRQSQYLYIREKQTYTGILYYNYGNYEKLNGEKSMVGYFNNVIEESKKLETYNFPNNKQLESYFPFSETILINKRESNDTSVSMYNNTEIIDKLPDCFIIEGWAFLEGYNTKNQKVYIGIKNEKEKQPIFYLSFQILRFDLSPYFNKPNLDYGGYLIRISNSLIKNGENKISVMVVNDNQTKIIETEKTIIK